MSTLCPLPTIGLLAALLCANPASAQTPLRNPANGHYYALIVLPTPISWRDANEAARNSVFQGQPGYLATITSAQENNFLRARVYPTPARPDHYSIWLGGFKLTSSTSPKKGWRWVTGEPWDFTYWAKGEPNDAGGAKIASSRTVPGPRPGTICGTLRVRGRTTSTSSPTSSSTGRWR